MALIVALGLSGPAFAQSPVEGGVARMDGEPAMAAWYADPTTRYPHGALGDTTEAGSLIVEVDSKRHRHVLPETQVFEDDTPRIVDLDRDGVFEIVTIRTDVAAGAAVAVYNVGESGIEERAATPPIGRSNRRLSIAAIERFDRTGQHLIAVVRTPHIGGELEVLQLHGNALTSRYPRLSGVTSHIYGDPETSFAAAADMDGDGRPDLVLTDHTRQTLLMLSFDAGEIRTRTHALPARLDGAITYTPSGPLQVPLETGPPTQIPIAE